MKKLTKEEFFESCRRDVEEAFEIKKGELVAEALIKKATEGLPNDRQPPATSNKITSTLLKNKRKRQARRYVATH